MTGKLTQAERNNFHGQFNAMLYEAMMKVLLAELNIVRVQAGLAEKTETELTAQIQTELDGLTEYDWMKEQI